jgi:predicted metal-dependent peptidase
MADMKMLSRTTKELLFDEPFYGHFASSLDKSFSRDINTAAVAKKGIGTALLVNPEFFESLSALHRKGLIKHELLHIAFNHLMMGESFPDKKLFNIAADLEINQHIKSEWLPEGGITLNSFPDLSLPKKAGTKEYYKLLQEEKDKGEDASDSFKNMMNGDGDSGFDQHDWKDFEDLNDAEKKLIQKQVEHQIVSIADEIEKSTGNMPGELKGLIEKLRHVEPAKFDWKGYLRRFVGSSIRSYTRILRRKPNKRYPDNPGLKIKYRNSVLVAIDTSGSVSDDEVKEFLNEIYHINKTGSYVDIIQCDTQIQSIEPFNPKQDFKVHGRGGTSFQPVIDYYNDNKSKYTTLIYLTDGEATAPKNCPKRTLWCHSSRSKINDKLPGYRIKLN